jgi:NADPH:quinone reductase-like Zn-dependent oxidoreductase
MRAARFNRAGEPADVLSVDEAATPVLGAGEVLVAVEVSVVQPADWMFIRGRYRIRPSFPQVAGLERTGLIVDAGDSTIANGTRGAFGHPGAWAERVAVPASSCYGVPEGIPVPSRPRSR